MGSLFQDLRYAVRIFRNAPGFTLVSVLTLALGIVGTVVVFNAYNAIMWQPVPVQDPARLAALNRHYRKGGLGESFTSEDFRRVRERTDVFSGVAAESAYDTVLAKFPSRQDGKFDEPKQALIKLVSDNYFEVLGVGARTGRVFTTADHDSTPVAVLSYSSWHRRFREDPSAVGKTVLVYDAAVTIVGIAPPDFVGSANPPIPPDLWLPLSSEAVIEPERVARPESEEWLRVLGRLKPGATFAQAEAELTTWAQQSEKARGVEVVTTSVVAQPVFYMVEPGDPQFRGLAALLLASFSMVLLIACANMANFFMARATMRRREMAVRTALGAKRSRLVRQLLTEGVLLGLSGGGVAVVFATWVCNFLWLEVEERIIARFTDLYVFRLTFVPTPRVLALTCVVSVLAGALFSLTGALQSSRLDLNEVMKGEQLAVRPARRLRLTMRDLLIAVQVTLSVVLLVTATVLARGMSRGQSADPGFSTRNVLNIEFAGLKAAGFDVSRSASLREQLRARLSTVPGFTAVAFSDHVPLLGVARSEVAKQGGIVHNAFGNNVSPGMFSVLGIPLVRGRDFTDTETAHQTAVVVVSQSTARNLWASEDPIGKWLLVGKARRPMEVIGVAQDVRSTNIARIDPYFVYLPLPPDAPRDDLFLRTSGDAGSMIPQTLASLAEVDKRLASLGVAHSLDDALWMQRMPSTIATLFAAIVGSLALVLATVGIYGTIAYAVAQRTREIGIRLALGARRRSIVSLVLSRTMALVGAAACIGLALSTLVARAISAIPFGLQNMFLFDISPHDPLAFIGAAFFLTLIALAAAYRPTARATRIDPMVALRYE